MVRAEMWWDVLVQFLDLVIVAGGGFVIGVGFMTIITAMAMKLKDREIHKLKDKIEELESAAGNRHEDEHPEMGRSPPLSPMGDVPGAGSGTVGDAPVGRT